MGGMRQAESVADRNERVPVHMVLGWNIMALICMPRYFGVLLSFYQKWSLFIALNFKPCDAWFWTSLADRFCRDLYFVEES